MFIIVLRLFISLQVVEESAKIQNNYETLSKQLVAELPLFIDNAVAILTLCTKSLISAHMYLQGHLAKLYLQLAQVIVFAKVSTTYHSKNT